MKFSVVGNSKNAACLVREIAKSSQHSLMPCAVSGALADTAARGQFPLRLVSSAEEAMLDPAVEVVVIAHDDLEEALRMARAASQADKNVVVVPPVSCSPAFSFELHLILDESKYAIIPWIGRFALSDLSVEQLHFAMDPRSVSQLSLEFPIRDSQPDTVRSAVQCGLDFLSASGFKYTQVTALEAHAPDGTFLSRLITLNSQDAAEIPCPPATLMLRPLAATAAVQSLVLRASRIDGSNIEYAIREDQPSLDRIEFLCRDRVQCVSWMEAFSITLELTEAVQKSLRRKRTVDVHFDSGSEKGVFKSQMTAIGCGILTFMMFGMVAYLVIAQLVDLPDWVLHVARVLWFTPLVLFLLAQALLPLARDRSEGRYSSRG